MTTTRRNRSILLILAILTLLYVPSGSNAHTDRWADSHSGNDRPSDVWDQEDREYKHAGRWGWGVNGCTKVPDSIRGVFHFGHACDHHDGCYGGHWASRLGCDNEFWRNMSASCNHDWPWYNFVSRRACRRVRNVYYAGVRALGYWAYNGWSISGPSGW